MLTFEQRKELIDLVCERRLQGIEVERSGFRLRIDGRAPDAPRPAPAPETPVATAGAAPPAKSEPAPEAESAPVAPAPKPPPAEELHILKSPIVGTFYSAPSPEAESYAQVGDRVKKGQVLCIVEAMKLMNEIESDVAGEIVEIYPKNAQPVEFGEALFAIRVT